MAHQLSLLASAGVGSHSAHGVRRRPETTPLYAVIHEHLESFLAAAERRERVVPRFVERELRAYLECGQLQFGFVRVRCESCGHGRLIAFSCYPELKTIRSPQDEGGVGKDKGWAQTGQRDRAW